MDSLRMDTQEVIDTGLNFLVIVFVLHLFAAILIGIGFLAIEVTTHEECEYTEGDGWSGTTCDDETPYMASMIAWACWGGAVVLLISGYIGLSSKLLTDSIAIGIYKANNAEVMGISQHVEENIPPPVILPPKLI